MSLRHFTVQAGLRAKQTAHQLGGQLATSWASGQASLLLLRPRDTHTSGAVFRVELGFAGLAVPQEGQGYQTIITLPTQTRKALLGEARRPRGGWFPGRSPFCSSGKLFQLLGRHILNHYVTPSLGRSWSRATRHQVGRERGPFTHLVPSCRLLVPFV